MTDNPDQLFGGDVGSSQMRKDLAEDKFLATSASLGGQFYALAAASVAEIDFEKLEVSLTTHTGETFSHVPIPLTFPGAGHRHFLGAVPEPGDLCIVGWGMRESGRTRVPWILSWVVPGATAGYDWLPTQPYSPEESGTPAKIKHLLEGTLARKRHKLRHMEPGNIVASSSQGSDLVLNESAMFSNRRGNEIHLRDQDQALVVRSLQQFHAGAGFRLYGGMVQRDATFLPTQLFSDGVDWASAQQVDAEGNPLDESELAESDYENGRLTAARVFQRSLEGTPDNDLALPTDINPFDFLTRGLFITKDGDLAADTEPEAVYGGKPIFRLSTDGANGVVDSSANVFTEYRIEVAHTADGTLPVTEQTDGFDANRLPGGSPEDLDPLGSSVDAPFIEWVMGSVVGNDPYSEAGRSQYGLPLYPSIFDGEIRSPALISGLGVEIEQHAASLFHVRPPLTDGNPTFFATTKDGRYFGSIQGPGSSWSAEVGLGAGLRLGSGTEPGGQSVQVDLDGSLILRAKTGRNADNLGVYLGSDQGAVKIFGGGALQEGGVAVRSAPSGGGEDVLPALVLESGTNALLKAAGTLTLSASDLRLENISGIKVGASSGLDFQSGAGISHSSNTYALSSTGRASFQHSGPKDGLPTNGALREISFTGSPATGFAGGTADKYELLYGDRDESLTAGSHSTTVMVGNQTYECQAGVLTLKSGQNTSVELTTASLSGRSSAVSFQASAGAASIQASAALSLQGQTAAITAAAVTVNSSSGTHAPTGGSPGGVLTDGALDPLTGKTFLMGGVIGSPTFRVN
jgi:hypothetical protein